MSVPDPAAVIAALKQVDAEQSAIIKNALVLLDQFAAKVVALEAKIANLEAQIAAVPDITTSIQTDTKSLSDGIAKYSASGQLSV